MTTPPPDDHFHQIYTGPRTDWYDAMISCEDVRGELRNAIHAQVKGANLLDVGAGTGRVGRLAKGVVTQVMSLDLNVPMLKIAARQSDGLFAAGDALHLPVRSGWAEVVTAGWVLGHFVGWFPDWRDRITRALDEFTRVTVPHGTQIIIETLGTGASQAAPPTQGLAAYYHLLEDRFGFTRQVLRTDYHFPDVETGARLVGFFFGDELRHHMESQQSRDLIEWTGFWVRRL
jgi:ubiquinone/menaquinone biosynthesis C-methylase UbiE